MYLPDYFAQITFARHHAERRRVSVRSIRKLRQRTGGPGKSALMPCDPGNISERERRFRPRWNHDAGKWLGMARGVRQAWKTRDGIEFR